MITNPSARLSCGSIRSACSHITFIAPSSHRTRRGGRGRLHICNLFTGIVQGKAEVRQVDRKDGFSSVRIAFPDNAVEGLQTGASVAINGTCLTATSISGDEVGFDIISETLRATNLGGLEEGSKVNYERSARMGAEIGGHNVSGHVHTTAEVVEVEDTDNNRRLAFQLREPKWIKYVLPKGFIAVDGCSLTVGEVWDSGFSVYLIPETLRVTTLGDKSTPGSTVNLEIETQTQIIVDTVERVVEQYMAGQAAAT